MKHRIKELLVALPVDTKEAKRLLLERTKIKYDRFHRILNNPSHRISPSDALSIAHFFSIDMKQLFYNDIDILDVVKEIVQNSDSIKSLIKYDEQKMVGASNNDGQTRGGNAPQRNLSACNA
jgi:hypothetical protein